MLFPTFPISKAALLDALNKHPTLRDALKNDKKQNRKSKAPANINSNTNIDVRTIQFLWPSSKHGFLVSLLHCTVGSSHTDTFYQASFV